MKVNGKLLQFNLYMLTKLQKNSFGKIKKKLPHRGSNPHQLRNNPNSTSFVTDPCTKASPPRCLHENSRQKSFTNKHFKLLVKYL